MPFLVPFIPLIAAVAGPLISNALAPSGPSASQIQAQQSAALAQQQAQQNATDQRNAVSAARQQFPNLQAALGGAVSPEYYAQTSAALTGNGQYSPAIQAALFGTGLSGPNPNAGAVNPAAQQALQQVLQSQSFPTSGGGMNGGIAA